MAPRSLVLLFLLATSSSVTRSEKVRMSCEMIRLIVDGHNSKRLEVARGKVDGQPAAVNMGKMVWDKELEIKASDWANKGLKEHNPDLTVASGRFIVGENIYRYATFGKHKKLNLTKALNNWFDENRNYDFSPISLEESDIYRHYTQMVWAESLYVGCGAAQRPWNRWMNSTVVCNYGPGGNLMGSRPYEKATVPQQELICGTDNCSRPYGDKC